MRIFIIFVMLDPVRYYDIEKSAIKLALGERTEMGNVKSGVAKLPPHRPRAGLTHRPTRPWPRAPRF